MTQGKAWTDQSDIRFRNAARASQRAAGECDDRRVDAEDFVQSPPKQSAPDSRQQFSGGGVHKANAFACVDPQHRRRQRLEPPFCIRRQGALWQRADDGVVHAAARSDSSSKS